MKRTLKFRMPIKNLDDSFSEWFYWGFVGDDDEFISPHSKYRQCPSFQFTGFTDKTGKDIYEGDIISYQEGKIILKVEFTDRNHGRKWGFGLVDKTGEEYTNYYGTTQYEFEQSEVIGNIYENPELLK